MLSPVDLLKGSSRLLCSVGSRWRCQGRADRILAEVTGRAKASPERESLGEAGSLLLSGERRWDVHGV